MFAYQNNISWVNYIWKHVSVYSLPWTVFLCGYIMRSSKELEMCVWESFLRSTHGCLRGLNQLPTHSFKHSVESKFCMPVCSRQKRLRNWVSYYVNEWMMRELILSLPVHTWTEWSSLFLISYNVHGVVTAISKSLVFPLPCTVPSLSSPSQVVHLMTVLMPKCTYSKTTLLSSIILYNHHNTEGQDGRVV